MHSDNSKIKDMFKDHIFNENEIEIISSVFHKIEAKKGDIILKSGDFANEQYFILDGCLRLFHIDINGKEHTIQFAINDWWICDFSAFYSSEKAIMSIEAIQDTTLYKISKKDKDYLHHKIPKLDHFFRIKLERAFGSFQKRILASIAHSAKERYLDFIASYPKIEKNIKNYHIASYLGITTESLSRIRKEISRA